MRRWGSPLNHYADEHVPRAVSKGLIRRGVDLVTCQQTGMLGASDEEHLHFATAQGRVIITQDIDFLRLHAAGESHAGIAYAPQGMSIGEMVAGLIFIYQALSADDMKDHVEFLWAPEEARQARHAEIASREDNRSHG